MIFKTFTYTKSDKTVSDRALLVLKKAADYDSGIDVTDMDALAFELFIDDMKLLEEKYLRKLNKVLAKYGKDKSYRNFKISRMANTTTVDDI